MKYMRLIEMI